jgi:hypothetical protein
MATLAAIARMTPLKDNAEFNTEGTEGAEKKE